MHTVFLGLGSNLGDRELHLNKAIEEIKLQIGTISAISSIIETAAWGKTDSPDYLNLVLKLETHIWPLALINKILAIESKLGRVRTEKWGSRIIDIDILYFNNWKFATPGLIIPHPFIEEREFVYKPLQEIRK